jgi:hypothetical protein
MTVDYPHGERRGYLRGCHCDPCRSAHAEYERRRRAVRQTLPAKEIPHGSGGYTNYRCRCAECTEGHRLRIHQYRDQRRNQPEVTA